MILRMPRPWRHPITAQLYYRARLPADVGKHFAGRTISVEVGGQTTRVKLNSHIKVSLRTKHAAEARPRHASVQSQLEQCWAAERNGAVSLSHKEIMALAGLWYRQMVADHEDDPGDAADWEVYQGLLADGLAYLDPDSDGVSSEPYSPRDGIRLLIRHGVHIEPVLEARGLKVDEATRLKLIEQVAISLCMAAETLIRRASGDYGPDRYVERYPVWTRSKPASCNTQGGPTLMQLFSGWAKEGRPAQSTFDQWRSYVASFQEFVGQDRASEIGRQHIRGWKDHLLDLGNSAKTINGSKLAALGAIFSWGVENDLVALDPTKGIKVKQKRKAGQRMLGFEKTEAAVILRASAKASSPVFRWVPLLCAQSGARVSEVCQLRGVDIRREDGIWVMAFRAEAGSLKTQGSERRVPPSTRMCSKRAF